MKELNNFLYHPKFLQLINFLEEKFAKFPHIPNDLLTSLKPLIRWFALVGGVMSVYGGYGTLSFAMGGSAYFSAWVQAFVGRPRSYFFLTGLSALISGILLLMAFRPLTEKKYRGWLLLAWSMLLACATTVLGILFSLPSLLASLAALVLGWYLLFEVKPFFPKKELKNE